MGSLTFFLVKVSGFMGFLKIILMTNRKLKGVGVIPKSVKPDFIARGLMSYLGPCEVSLFLIGGCGVMNHSTLKTSENLFIL